MNILLTNWRDPRNNKSGGAEILNMHILKSLLERGVTVTWYAMSSEGLKKSEIYENITIIRYGNIFTHFLYFPWLLLTKKFGQIDLVIDSIHGTGYLTPLLMPRTRKIVLICEVAKNIWDEMLPFPISWVGKKWEKIMMKLYGRNTFWTISESTKKDLVELGIERKKIEVIPMGFDALSLQKRVEKDEKPTALFVGRLTEMKGIKDAISAIELVNLRSNIKWQLKIIGRGEKEYERELKRIVKEKELGQFINFLGFVSEKSKFTEMAKSWVLLVPSSREGWGMIVPEANSVGTSVIGYNVPGLRDSLKAYSKMNILVNTSPQSVANELMKMKKPLIINERITPGWSQLEKFVLSRV